MTTTEIEESIMDSLFCEDCAGEANDIIAAWEKDGQEAEKPMFHPIMGKPVHFIRDLAFRLGIGGTMCGSQQGYIVP